MDDLFDRLKNVRQTGSNSWKACCPYHDDRNPSLSISLTDDRRNRLHCYARCSVPDVVAALGLEMHDQFPVRENQSNPPRHFLAIEVLERASFEGLVVAATALAILASEPVAREMRERFVLAVLRLQAAISSAMPIMTRRTHA